uniref:Phosphatidate cytidylyltransferase, mitochondrial n=1 Tax=Oryza glaberrima TaxID=4538 RepID=I1PU53_ORYGL
MRLAEEGGLASPLDELLPPVDFCCAYGSTLLHARSGAASMIDYILGIPDPLKWHSENLERNPAHYSGWMACLGPGAITRLADSIGVGVYFNPFVEWRDKVAFATKPPLFVFPKVGAGLPVIASVTHIIASGDPVCLLWFSHIVGSLSGTLGYVMSELEDGKRFSEVVKTASFPEFSDACDKFTYSAI